MVRSANRALLCFSLIGALVSQSSCGGATKSARPVSYRETARSNYERGLAELKDDNHAEAAKFFNFVKNKFPFSRFATLAELGLADTLFAQEKYTGAVDAYQLFVKFHPTHPKVRDGYVEYRICAAYVKQIPSDWFLVPPSHEKDQSATRAAVRELVGFTRKHPRSKHAEQVRELYRKAVRKLVDHELYVARFYLKRDKPRATILRLEGVLQRYSDVGVDPEVMLLLGKTYMRLKQQTKARKTFSALVRKYPRDANASKARLYLQHLTRQ